MNLSQLPGLSSTPATQAPADSRTWSRYQQAVFDCAATGTGNAVIEAVAGSGKTTTLVEALKRWQAAGNFNKRALFAAFNKAIAVELERRVPQGVEAKTLHGVCFGAVRRAFPKVKVDDHKLDDIARGMVKGFSTEAARKVIGDITRAYGLLKGTMADLTNAEACLETLAEFGVTLDDANTSVEMLPKVDEKMRADQTRITFDEMLSFVIDHGCPLAQYDMLMVDEAQDLCLLQIALLKKMLKPTGRAIFCGDSSQAIYLFRGADSAAMDRIRREFNAPAENQLPLSITYRCGTEIVEYAQSYVPHIEAAPGAHTGKVEERSDSHKQFNATLFDMKPGDMGICRANAPLVSCALRLIAERRPACIKGRDIGKSVQKLARDLAKKASSGSIVSLARVVRDYQSKQTEKLRAAKKDRQADSVEDRCETLLAIIDGADSMNEVDHRIEMIFSDNAQNDAVVFSSIHKSKGLESDTVVWIGPEISGWILSKCKNESAKAQEANLSYVAITRAKRLLIVQPLPPRKGEGEEE